MRKSILFFLLVISYLNVTAQLYTPEVEVRDDLNGNVGIGTTSPKKALHVGGDYYGKGHLFLHAHEGDGNSGTAYVQARDDSGNSSIDLQFRTQKNGLISSVMKLTKDGNVGIGNMNPQYTLDISRNFSDLRVRNSSNNREILILPGAAAIDCNTDLILNRYNSNNVRIAEGGGRVGIGTTSPAYKLHVSGSAGASVFYTTSDQRLKKNVKEVRQKNLEGIKAYEYTYAEDTTNTMHYGLMAQEVERVFPHMVKTDEEGYKAIAYDEFIPLLIEENRRLNRELADLKERIEKLEK